MAIPSAPSGLPPLDPRRPPRRAADSWLRARGAPRARGAVGVAVELLPARGVGHVGSTRTLRPCPVRAPRHDREPLAPAPGPAHAPLDPGRERGDLSHGVSRGFRGRFRAGGRDPLRGYAMTWKRRLREFAQARGYDVVPYPAPDFDPAFLETLRLV